jgi:hypothetical protein
MLISSEVEEENVPVLGLVALGESSVETGGLELSGSRTTSRVSIF